MLDFAASRGLQIIVLTCNPSDYAALGAKQILLSRAAPTPALGTAAQLNRFAPEEAEGLQDDASGDVAPRVDTGPVSEEQIQAFICALQSLGGSAGNGTLRRTLGWDEAAYNGVKERLFASGRLLKGRGKGGSVSLSGEEMQTERE
jgi:hypothetical protein